MTSRDRTIVLVLALLALAGGFWFLALKPKRAEVKAAETQILAQRKRVQTAQATVTAGLQAKAGYPADYATVAKLGEAVPADDELPSLLFQLETAARGADVDFRGLTRAAGNNAAATSSSTPASGSAATQTAASALPPGATVGTAGLATLPFNLDFTGSYADLERFIQEVQRFVRPSQDTVAVSGRLLTIDGVSLQPGSDDLSKIKAKIAATAYLSPQTKTAGSGGKTPSAGSPSTGSTGSGPTASAPTSSAIPEGGTR
jgi:Tfp pilus assembly protein PilO